MGRTERRAARRAARQARKQGADGFHGFVSNVVEETDGDQLAAAAAAGATVLTLDLLLETEFSPLCWVRLGGPGGQVVQVTDLAVAEDQSGTLTIGTPTTAALEVGDRVDVWNPAAGTVYSEWYADVRDSTDGTVRQFPLAHALIPTLGDGDSLIGASVTVEADDEGRKRITEVHGKTPTYGTDLYAGQRVLFTGPTEVDEFGPHIDYTPYQPTGSPPTDAARLGVFGSTIDGGSTPAIFFVTQPNGDTELHLEAFTIDSGGALGEGLQASIGALVAAGRTAATDVEITSATKGVILRSPNGTRWRVTIDNSGNLVRTAL